MSNSQTSLTRSLSQRSQTLWLDIDLMCQHEHTWLFAFSNTLDFLPFRTHRKCLIPVCSLKRACFIRFLRKNSPRTLSPPILNYIGFRSAFYQKQVPYEVDMFARTFVFGSVWEQQQVPVTCRRRQVVLSFFTAVLQQKQLPPTFAIDI